jgi:hypothetical protein
MTRATLSVWFVATLLASSAMHATPVSGAASVAPDTCSIAPNAPETMTPAGGNASPQLPESWANVVPVPASPEQPGTPAPTPLFECSPTCPYYYTYCQEICTNRGGIKSFNCIPTYPPHCATFTCTCNKGL